MVGDADRELETVEPHWCGDTRVHRSHTWIDESKLPKINLHAPLSETIQFRPEICRGVRPWDWPS